MAQQNTTLNNQIGTLRIRFCRQKSWLLPALGELHFVAPLDKGQFPDGQLEIDIDR